MEEIAQQFCEELQELLDRYKTRLSVPRIMHFAQDIFHKTLSFRYNPKLHNIAEEHLQQIISSGPSFLRKHAITHSCPNCNIPMMQCKHCDNVYWFCTRCGYKLENTSI